MPGRAQRDDCRVAFVKVAERGAEVLIRDVGTVDAAFEPVEGRTRAGGLDAPRGGEAVVAENEDRDRRGHRSVHFRPGTMMIEK